MLSIIKNKIKKYNLNKKWRKINSHNQTILGTIFPFDSVKVGSYSYGVLNLLIYDITNKIDKLEIGNFVSIAGKVNFFLCENHQTKTFSTFPLKTMFQKRQLPEDAKSRGSIIIEDEVWIGYGATILSGVTIGKGAIIATGAVVTCNIPPYTVAVGIPAKVIKNRFPDEITKRLLNLKLIDIHENIIEKNLDLFYKEINTSEDLASIELLFDK